MLTLEEFNKLAAELPWRPVDMFREVPKIVAVEPLEGRNTFEVQRRVILEKDGEKFVSRWD